MLIYFILSLIYSSVSPNISLNFFSIYFVFMFFISYYFFDFLNSLGCVSISLVYSMSLFVKKLLFFYPNTSV